MSSFRNRILPAAGLSKPETVFMSVVFPAPLAPRMQTIAPSATSRSIPFIAWMFP
jgi:hypothetical protein